MKKRLLRVLDIAVTTLLVLMIVTTTYLAVAARRSPDRIPTVFGRKVLTVLSGSMAPAIRTGDVILIRPLSPGETIHEGDVITYRVAGAAKTMITHRVVGTVAVDGKAAAYVTKGDANPSQDQATVSPLQIVGLYQWRIPFFGYVTNFIRQPLGIVLVVILPGVILIGMELRRLWKLMAEAEAKSKENHSSPLPPA